MARPSIGSQYFQEIAEQAQLRRQSAKHEALAGKEHTTKSQSPFEAGLHNSTSKSNGSKADEEIERLKQKFAIQNKSLAQQNSAMSSKLTDMETKISDLINENMTLRKSNMTQDKNGRAQLDRKLSVIESKLLTKFDDILQVLKDIRYEEGLPENSHLNALREFSRPVTSTPLNEIELEHDEPMAGAFRQVDNPSRASLFLGSLRNDLDRIPHNEPIDTTFSKVPLHQSTPPLAEKGESETESSRESTNESTNEKANEGMMELSETKNDSISGQLTTVLPEGIKDTPDVGAVDNNPQDITLVGDSVSKKKSLNKSRASKKITKDREVQDKTVQHSPPKSSHSKTSQIIQSEPSESQSQHESQENERGRRSSRVRKNINYAEPKTGSKIRRESEKFVDAVGGYLPRFKVKEETSDKPQSQIQSQESRKRRPELSNENTQGLSSPDTAKTTKKRKPLSNVTNSTNVSTTVHKFGDKKTAPNTTHARSGMEIPPGPPNIQTQLQTQAPLDLSVFDFEDRSTASKPKRSYRRRSSFAKPVH